ncbi:MAG: N-formylglutamate amidohydrolase [Alphaproteobacteria bacterium]|nr:N-formylglutamate amidohydrolase [Alphaproteobacteria bacterium]
MRNVLSNAMIDVSIPQSSAAPLVLDSPHSGSMYPEDFHYIVPQFWLRQTEDSYVDELFSFAPSLGATLMKANFTRSYIDVNRAIDDLDPTMISGTLPFALEPTERSFAGYGLIRHLCRGQAVYANKLSAEEIQKRLQECYTPYHALLKKLINDVHSQFGAVWHINCHSMPSHMAVKARPDFILGDRDGASSEPEFIHVLTDAIKRLGYSVAHNDPYKGVEIVHRYGHPRAGFHSVQLEINRALYMDEETLERSANFAVLKRDLAKIIQDIKSWIAQRGEPEQMVAE